VDIRCGSAASHAHSVCENGNLTVDGSDWGHLRSDLFQKCGDLVRRLAAVLLKCRGSTFQSSAHFGIGGLVKCRFKLRLA